MSAKMYGKQNDAWIDYYMKEATKKNPVMAIPCSLVKHEHIKLSRRIQKFLSL